jgi:hypothetical protein
VLDIDEEQRMSSIVSDDTWFGQDCYVTAAEDLRHHEFDPVKTEIGTTCLVTFSSGLFRKVDERLAHVVTEFEWPYTTTPLRVCTTRSGKRFALHFPSYGGSRIANSLEQLAACGVRHVIGLGMGGTPQDTIEIGDTVLLEGAIRGDGVSRYYSPIEFPAVADLDLTARLHAHLAAQNSRHHVGLSFGTDALYREEESLNRPGFRGDPRRGRLSSPARHAPARASRAQGGQPRRSTDRLTGDSRGPLRGNRRRHSSLGVVSATIDATRR